MTLPYIDAEGHTFGELLEFMRDFGSRYRLWKGKSGRVALTPQEVLSSFDPLDPVLRQISEIGPVTTQLGNRTLYGWRVFFYPQQPHRSKQSQKPSPYIIEDLLAEWEVRDWLHQQEPDRIVAVLPHDARISTFLQTYYLDILGHIPDYLETARLPLWCVYLEGFIRGLNPRQLLPYIEVSARTLSVWLGLLVAVCTEAESGSELNDGEYGWEEVKDFEQINAQLARDPVTLPYGLSRVRAGEGMFTLCCQGEILTITYAGALVLDGADLLLLDEHRECVSRGPYKEGKARLAAPSEKGGYILQIVQNAS